MAGYFVNCSALNRLLALERVVNRKGCLWRIVALARPDAKSARSKSTVLELSIS
jgi:hypothetical protein